MPELRRIWGVLIDPAERMTSFVAWTVTLGATVELINNYNAI